LPHIGFDAHAIAGRRRFSEAAGTRPLAAVKLDHGGNPAKALPRAAELELLRALRARGWRVLLDRGFGDEELANSDALLSELAWRPRDLDDSGRGLGQPLTGLAPGALVNEDVIRFHGSIAGWAAALSSCGLALSYDSVGHHLAAALGVPVIVAFTGYSDAAFPVAWQPRGAGRVTVVAIPTAEKQRAEQWQRVIEEIPEAR
jgi:ADP-heptose:LPS heptosyltransferase